MATQSRQKLASVPPIARAVRVAVVAETENNTTASRAKTIVQPGSGCSFNRKERKEHIGKKLRKMVIVQGVTEPVSIVPLSELPKFLTLCSFAFSALNSIVHFRFLNLKSR